MLLTEPTLLLDQDRCLNNIAAMAAKAKRHNVHFRPHFKTHQSHAIGRWFRDVGVKAITVSSLKMASYFADDGWNDITVAFPANILEIDRINHLATNIQLNLVVVSPETISFLERRLLREVGVFIKIDAGYHRTGIPSSQLDEIDTLVSAIVKSKHLRLKGFLTHSGNTYQARSRNEIIAMHEEMRVIMTRLKLHYHSSHPELIVTAGDTPGCSVSENFEGIDEVRPGNFVFYDVMQWRLGSCSSNEIAVALACPVVAKRPERNQLIIYGGAIHFSKDSIILDDKQCFGVGVGIRDGRWSLPLQDVLLSSISQEHGIITASEEFIRTTETGSVIGILPVHSCLTADCMKGYYSVRAGYIDHMSGKL